MDGDATTIMSGKTNIGLVTIDIYTAYYKQ